VQQRISTAMILLDLLSVGSLWVVNVSYTVRTVSLGHVRAITTIALIQFREIRGMRRGKFMSQTMATIVGRGVLSRIMHGAMTLRVGILVTQTRAKKCALLWIDIVQTEVTLALADIWPHSFLR